MLLVLGGTIIYVITKSSTTDAKTETAQTSTASGRLGTSDAPSISQGQPGGISVGADTPQGGSFGLQSNLGQQNGSSSKTASNFPGPESFGIYDEHKSGKAALFGDIIVGDGAEVKEGVKVAVLYQGWLTNGTLFDQSKTNDKGQTEAFLFEVGKHQVIVGWEQDIVGMKVGGKRRFIIPPAVGYGASAQGTIPANSTLVFDVTLVSTQ